jgi:hypothetical protein
MTRSTVDGRPVFLTRTRSGWAVKWGRTIIARRPTWQQALDEILKLYRA